MKISGSIPVAALDVAATDSGMELRPYQTQAVETIRDYLRTALVAGLIMPTGAGKSITVTALLRRLIGGRKFRLVVVATPQNHITDGFREADLSLWKSGKPKKADLARFIVQTKRGDHFGLLCSHALLTTRRLDLPQDLTGCLLVLDEGHHAGAATTVAGEAKGTKQRRDYVNRLSAFRDEWIRRGGSVLIVTATPWRNDRADVLGGAPVYHRTLAEHMADPAGYCPPKLSVEHVVIQESVASFKDAKPRTVAKAAEAMVQRWLKDGRPKTVVIVPSRKADVWVAAIEKAFGRHKARTQITVGSRDQAVALRRVLDHERAVTRYEDSIVDVMIACKRFDEGTDWPICSHVYVAGLPRQMNTTVQRVGRGLRSKKGIKGHPHGKAATITFFAPRWNKDTDEVRRRHRDEAMMLACWMADHETGARFLNDPFGDVLRSRSKSKRGTVLTRLVHRLKASDAERAEAAAEIQRIRARLGKGATAEALLQAICKASDVQVWDDRRDVLTTLLLAAEEQRRGNAALGKDIERRLLKRAKAALGLTGTTGKTKARARTSETDLIRAEMRAIWDAAVETHGAATVAEVNPAVVAMVSEYTGMDAMTFSESLSMFDGSMVVWSSVDWSKTDTSIARSLGCSQATAWKMRRELGREIKRDRWDNLPLGKISDSEVAKMIGCTASSVCAQRKKRGIAPVGARTRVRISKSIWDRQPFGREPDVAIARRLGVRPTAVHKQRTKRDIAPFRESRT